MAKKIRRKVRRKYRQGFALIANPAIADKRFTKFAKMAKTPVYMGYDAAYAMYVHEDLPKGVKKEYTKPDTGPKYLWRAVVQMKKEMRAAWREEVRRFQKSLGDNDPQPYMEPAAREAAAWVAMNRSLEIVPEETGHLRDSHYVTVGKSQYDRGGARHGTEIQDYVNYS
jgi:hypothetical protein